MIRNILLTALTLTLFNCQENLKYETYVFDNISVNLDRSISGYTRNQIIEDLKIQTSTGLLKIPTLEEISIDSMLFSYLLTIGTTDSIDEISKPFIQGYCELLAKDYLEKKPIHAFLKYNNEYLEYDTSKLIDNNNIRFQNNRLLATSKGVGIYLFSMLNKIIINQTKYIELSEPLIAEVSSDSNVYKIDLIINPDNLNLNQIRDSLLTIDPFIKILVLDTEHLQISFRDSLRNELIRGIYYR